MKLGDSGWIGWQIDEDGLRFFARTVHCRAGMALSSAGGLEIVSVTSRAVWPGSESRVDDSFNVFDRLVSTLVQFNVHPPQARPPSSITSREFQKLPMCGEPRLGMNTPRVAILLFA